MDDLISIRECARRIGVSDTAVHKALKAGRISISGNTQSGRPLLSWSDVSQRWETELSVSKRSHVGPKNTARNVNNESVIKLNTSANMDAQANAGADSRQQSPPPVSAGSYAQARAAREVYEAKLAKLKFDHQSAALIPVDDVKILWFRLVTAAKMRIMGVPSEIRTKFKDLNPEVIDEIEEICRSALDELANGSV